MMKNKEMSPRDRRLIELLSQGLSNKAIARRMGLKHGTTRVYLHQLYRKIGVAGKTAAVVWHIDHAARSERQKTLRTTAAFAGSSAAISEESAGDFALRTSLFTALGAMGLLVGPHSRVWEVAVRLKGEQGDAAAAERRRRSRGLWEALLSGDVSYGKRVYDDPDEMRHVVGSPLDGVQMALLLWLGGHSAAAARVTSQLARAKHGSPRASARDIHFLEAVRDAIEMRKAEALERIYRSAVDAAAHSPARHVAMAALFHAYAAHSDAERARRTAQALWAEAEAARQHLLAMGERVFVPDVSLPRPASALASGSTSRHKEEVTGR